MLIFLRAQTSFPTVLSLFSQAYLFAPGGPYRRSYLSDYYLVRISYGIIKPVSVISLHLMLPHRAVGYALSAESTVYIPESLVSLTPTVVLGPVPCRSHMFRPPYLFVTHTWRKLIQLTHLEASVSATNCCPSGFFSTVLVTNGFIGQSKIVGW